ncbi:phage antirepressor KilAC domain-containing protein [Alicyclobacillus mengziensis]|nr:phage antirepressor KilAC domain-containing protein [Alicyclobacillus mengziensis]
MNKLTLVKTESFGPAQCDFWQNENGDVFMTINQLANALGYAGRDGIEKMIERNPYLTDEEFSVADILSATDGKQYNTRLFTEDGIYEVSMLAKTPKAREFRTWVRQVIKTIRKTGGYVANEDLFINMYLPFADEQTKLAFRATLEVIRNQNEKIALMQAKADYFDALVERNLLTNFRDTAKELGIKQHDFVKWLLENKYIYRDHKQRLKPQARFVPELFNVKEWQRGGNGGTQTLVTPRGRETFRLLLQNQADVDSKNTEEETSAR